MKTPTTDRWRYRKSGQHGFSEDTFTGYPALAAAIVRQAVEDYREAERLERGEIHYSSLGIYCPAQTKNETAYLRDEIVKTSDRREILMSTRLYVEKNHPELLRREVQE